MYQYRPQNEDELELCEGDRVDVMQQCDDGWFVGAWARGLSRDSPWEHLRQGPGPLQPEEEEGIGLCPTPAPSLPLAPREQPK